MMRWTILALVVVVGLIVDQLNYSGYYRQEVVRVIDKGAARIGAWFR
jgi:hypothetical protein